ncbi:uncharacterized protein IL334_005050 [Kwoniella shivajii]|uniref:Uncharacterized protein n=1 Tax=Kwoniella shivajii TaxID=564305 RepID=A0ABZ1D3U6_9TREE|nr:hypothetical protein IL334_005050 [Kwoniella shivajii]
MTWTKITIASNRHEMWISGCQAIFAGFVSSAIETGVPPAIKDFWTTDQAILLEATLMEILHSDLMKLASARYCDPLGKENDKLALQMILYDILSSTHNKYTKPISCPANIVESIDQRWAMTKAGRETFRLRLDLPKRSDFSA